MRSSPHPSLLALAARCRDWLAQCVAGLAPFAHLLGDLGAAARELRAYDRYLVAIILTLAFKTFRWPPLRRTWRPRSVAPGFARRLHVRNSKWRFWTRGLLPKHERSFAGAIARLARILRDVDLYAARLRKRFARGFSARVLALAPPALVFAHSEPAPRPAPANSS